MTEEKTAKLIRDARKQKGMTQKELASRLGVSVQAVSKWENAKGLPDILLLEPLSKELDLSVAELVTGDSEEAEARPEAALKDEIDVSVRQMKKKAAALKLALAILALGVIVGIVWLSLPKHIPENEDPEESQTWERQSEYRYPGGTEADAVAAMEDFLGSHYGKEAENFKRMTLRNYWRYQYNGVNTDYVYSFRIEQGETVICDNTGGADLSQIKARIDEFLGKYHPDIKTDTIWMQKREAYLSTEFDTIEGHYTVGSVLYCAKDDQFYEFMQYDVVNDEGWRAARDVVFDPIEW